MTPPPNTQKPKKKSPLFPSENDASLSSISGRRSADSSKVKKYEKGISNSQGDGNDDAVVSDDGEEKRMFSSYVEACKESAPVDPDSTADVAEFHGQADDASTPNGKETTSPCVGMEKKCSSAVEKDKSASVGNEPESVLTAKINEIHDDDHAEDNNKEFAAQIQMAGTEEDEDSSCVQTCEVASVNQEMKSAKYIFPS